MAPSSKSPSASTPSSSKKRKSPPPSISSPLTNNNQTTTKQQTNKQTSSPKAPSKSNLDVTVHRLRSLSYTPSPVLHLAPSPPTPGTYGNSAYVAIARSDGSVCLVSANQKYKTIHTISGSKIGVLSSLTWTSRKAEENSDVYIHELWGTTLTNYIFRCDFITLSFKNATSVGGSDSGCNSGILTSYNSYIAVSGVSGTVRIYDCSLGREDMDLSGYNSDGELEDNEDDLDLQLIKTVPLTTVHKSERAVTSMVWSPTSSSASSSSSPEVIPPLYVALGDGTIRKLEHKLSPSSTATRITQTSRFTVTLRITTDGSSGSGSSIHVSKTSLQSGRVSSKIFTMAVTPDTKHLVTGSSTGKLQIWEVENGVLTTTIMQNATSDSVLCTCISPCGNKIYASGSDTRVIQIEKEGGSGSGGSVRWVQSVVHRPHTHPVCGMGVVMQSSAYGWGDNSYVKGDKKPSSSSSSRKEDNARPQQQTKPQPILLTGSSDTKICAYSINNFKATRPNKIFPWPEMSPCALGKLGESGGGGKVMVMFKGVDVEVYRFGGDSDSGDGSASTSSSSSTPNQQQLRIVGTITSNSEGYNVVSIALSPDAKLLAISYFNGLVIYKLSYDAGSNGIDFLASEIAVSEEMNVCCSALVFGSGEGSGEGYTLIAATADGPVNVIDVHVDDDEEEDDEDDDEDDGKTSCAVRIRIPLPNKIESLASSSSSKKHKLRSSPVSSMTLSPCNTYLACSRSTHTNESIHIYNLSTLRPTSDSDSSDTDDQVFWTLPKLEAPHSVVRFFSGTNDTKNNSEDSVPTLAIACTNMSFYIFSIPSKTLSDYTSDTGIPVSDNLPHELVNRDRDYPISLAFDPMAGNTVIIGCNSFFCYVDLERAAPEDVVYHPPGCMAGENALRKRGESLKVKIKEAKAGGVNAGGVSANANKKRKLSKRQKKRLEMSGGAALDTTANGSSHAEQNDYSNTAVTKQNNFKIVTNYTNMLFLDFSGKKEMVVVEQPWADVVGRLGDVKDVKIYGN